MKHRPKLTLELYAAGLLLLSAALTVWTAVLQPRWAWVPLAALLAVVLLLLVLGRQFRRGIARWLNAGIPDKAPGKGSMAHMSAPTALFSGRTLVWYNEAFRDNLLGGEDSVLQGSAQLLPDLDLRLCAHAGGQVFRDRGRSWHAYASASDGEAERVSLVCFSEETHLRAVAQEYKASRPGCLLFAIDGYEDVFGDLLDSERARMLEGINRVLEERIAAASGLLRRTSGGRFIAVVEERWLEKFAQDRYSILDEIRELAPESNLSLSIGIGRGGSTLQQLQEMAGQALDMAQGRGGDQAAEKTPDGFTFYGGVSHGVEKRSRVKSRIVAAALVDLIRQADSVIIMGHRASDLDAIGAAEGVLRICKICDVPAVIVVRRRETLAGSLIDAFEAAGCADDFIEPEDALDTVSKKTLCVIVDTYLEHLVESHDIYEKCGSVVVIDHHRKAVGHIGDAVLVCHEPYASSASELVTEILEYVGGKDDRPTRLEAEGLLAGIMLDTRSFSLHTGVRTFEAAATLRRCGAETENVRALFNTSLAQYAAKCGMVEAAKTYKGCAIALCPALDAGMEIAVPQAANDLLTIEGIEASFVAVRSGSGVNLSARSMGRVNVQVIAEALGGGGHQTMAGAQLQDCTLEEADARLRAAIDEYRGAQAGKK